MSETEPANLNQRLRMGSPDALAWFYQQHVRALWRFVHRRTGQHRETSDDLVSQIFLSMIESLPQFDQAKGSLEAWLYTIARRRIADHLRQHYRKRNHLQLTTHNTTDIPDDSNTPEQLAKLLAEENRLLVNTTLQQLPAVHRDALIWAHCDGLSTKRIAARLGRSVKAAENILYRARKRFTSVFAQQSDNAPCHAADAFKADPHLRSRA